MICGARLCILQGIHKQGFEYQKVGNSNCIYKYKSEGDRIKLRGGDDDWVGRGDLDLELELELRWF